MTRKTVTKTRRYGAVDYVPKPIGREMLYQALQRANAALAARDAVPFPPAS